MLLSQHSSVSEVSASDSGFKPHRSLLAGTWKRMAQPAEGSAGVAPEVNLMERVTHMLPPSVNKAAPLALKPREDVTRSPKQGVQWPHKKDLCICFHQV